MAEIQYSLNDKRMQGYLTFLDQVRAAGTVNMFESAPLLVEKFDDLTDKEAKSVVIFWMETFDQRFPETEEKRDPKPHILVLRYFDDEGCVFCLVNGCDYKIESGQILQGKNAIMDAVLSGTPLEDYLSGLEAEDARLQAVISKNSLPLSSGLEEWKDVNAKP